MELQLLQTAATTLTSWTRRTTTRRQRRAFPELPLGLALALATLPARASSDEARAFAAELLPRVARTMGLPAPRALAVEVLSPDAAKARLARGLAPDTLGRLGEALVAVGLAKPGTDLPRLASAFHADTASGFFEPSTRTLVLIEGQPLEEQRAVLAHELAHAVQFAQPAVARAFADKTRTDDAELALLAALEGQAQATAALVMNQLLEKAGVKVPDMAALIADTRAASAIALAQDAPTPWLGLQLRYPYQAGQKLVAALATEADPVARHLLARLPESTAEVDDLIRRRPAKGRERWGLGLLRRIPRSSDPWHSSLGCAGLELLGELTGKGPLCEGWVADVVESVRRGGEPVVVWMVLFETPEQAARLHAALASLGPRPGVELSRREHAVALLSNVPADGRTSVLRAANQLPPKATAP